MLFKKDYRDKIQFEIVEAFHGILYPNKKILNSGSECSELEDYLHTSFSGKLWEEIPVDTIQKNYAALNFGTPQFHRWILPAYMTCALEYWDDYTEHGDSSWCLLIDQTCWEIACVVIGHLEEKFAKDPSDENKRCLKDSINYTIKQRSLLSTKQKLTLKNFLKFATIYSADEDSRYTAYIAIERQYYLL